MATGGTSPPPRKPTPPKRRRGKGKGKANAAPGSLDLIKPKRPKRKPYDPLQPLTGRAFRREVNSLTRLQYQPLESQLAAERRTSKQQMVNTGNYYDQYQAILREADARTQAGYQQAQQAVNAQTAQSIGQDTELNKRVQEEAQRSAALRGAQADPGVGAQALAARTALSNNMAGLVGAHGAAQNAFGATRLAASGAARLGALREEQGRRNLIESSGRQLAREKGAFKTKARQDLTQSERRYQLERSAFGLDVAEAEESKRANKARERQNRRNARLIARDRAIDNMLQERRFQLDLEEFGVEKAKDNYKRRHGLGPYRPTAGAGGFTPREIRKNRGQFQRLVRFARNRKVPPGSPDPLLVKAAREYVRNGGVSGGTARKLERSFGFAPPRYKSAPPKRPGPQTS